MVQLLGVVGLLAVLAVGCGSSGSDSSSATGVPGADNASGTGTGTNDTTPNIVIPAVGDPTPGGTLKMALEAETDGYDPTQNRWANSGTEVAVAIFDPLVALDKDLKAQPYLAQQLEPSDEFRTWTITLRPDVKFHDGEPLDAAAVKKFMTMFKASALTGAAARPISTLEVDPTNPLVLKLGMSEPWSTFPYFLTAQGGVIPSPKQLDDPTNGPSHPVGTGPFVFGTWKRDDTLTVTRNPSYWRAGLPYLDGVAFKPIPDTTTRYQALKVGDINVMITSQERTAKLLLQDAKDEKLQVVRSRGDNDANMVLINTSKPPFDDVRMRQALAYGIDREQLADITGQDPSLAADSLYATDSPWYSNTDYPTYEPEKAKALVQAYEQDKGAGSAVFAFGATTDPEVIRSQQALAAMWTAIGIEVQQKSEEQATFILGAVAGTYQAQVWRQFGGADPDLNYTWWLSSNTEPPLALNMARNKDPEIDAALRAGRATTVFADRKVQYDKISVRMKEDLPYIWLSHLRWTLAADMKMRGIDGSTLPDGGKSAPLVGGVAPVVGMWIQQ